MTFRPDTNGIISEVFDFHAREGSFSPCQKVFVYVCVFSRAALVFFIHTVNRAISGQFSNVYVRLRVFFTFPRS